MAKLSRISDVVISLGTLAINEKSFNDMMVFGPHVLSTARVLVVTQASDLLDLGMSPTDPVYLAVRNAFSPTPSVRQVFVGRQHVDRVTVTVDRASVSTYSLDLECVNQDGTKTSETVSYTALVADSAEDIATALAAAVAASGLPVAAAASGSALTLTTAVTGQAMSLQVGGNLSYVVEASTEAVDVALSACNKEQSGWYGLIPSSRVAAEVLAAAAWVEANDKLMLSASSNKAVVDATSTDDIGAQVKARNLYRTTVVYSKKAASEYPEAALMSNRLTYRAGTESWANVQLAGVTADTLTEAEYLAAKAKNVTTFEVFDGGFAVTQGGKVGAGEWIDIIRLRDQMVEQIKVSTVGCIVRNTNSRGKVPMTDDGIQMIKNAIRGPLDENVQIGGLAPEELDAAGNVIPSYTIRVPRASEVSTNDKANRTVKSFNFTARPSGAIHLTEIRGALQYDL